MDGIHARFIERIQLAQIYAEDGEFHSAARVLNQLSDELKAHGDLCNKFVAEMLATPEDEANHQEAKNHDSH